MEYKYLNDNITTEYVKTLSMDECVNLCAEIRDCLINTVSKNGGHLASSLGAVELTVALHRVYNAPSDAIVFDVGHQSYAHKIITDRYSRFSSLRQENGISGFMRPQESKYDSFVTGHSSNSISAAYGIYKAKRIKGEEGTAIAVIGDGAMTGGMAFEALNNAGNEKSNFVVILNDNKMSISKNVGAMARYLTRIRSKVSYHSFKKRFNSFLTHIPLIGKPLRKRLVSSKIMLKNAIYHSNIFESLGFQYYGPVDGNNLSAVENMLKIVKSQNRPALVHVVTQKGKGYSYAENEPNVYHGVSGFDIKKGACQNTSLNYSAVVGETLCELAKDDARICAVTAAMKQGTGLDNFAKLYKNRFFDVGIAEQHAVTFSAGLAKGDLRPYFVVYSSFLQRGYDQILHDAAIEGLPIRLCVDRAGIVGEDGETHQGMFDVAFLSSIPGVAAYSPASYNELRKTIINTVDAKGIVAVRYPRGGEQCNPDFVFSGKDYDVFFNGNKAIISYGRLSYNAYRAASNSNNCCFIKLNKIFPLSDELVNNLITLDELYFFEETVKSGSVGEKLFAMLAQNGYKGKMRHICVGDTFIPHMTVESALKKYSLDEESMIRIIKEDD